jgi:8-oxo-dGTP pyrophosphatase MutT (NUDIX family)
LEFVEVEGRRAVRAVVLDGRNRLLLVRFSLQGDGEFWATPGGGIEDGESDVEALRRELAEEVGLTDAPIGRCLWTRVHTFPWDGRTIRQETIYLVRVEEHDAAPTVDLAAEGVAETRWWSLSDVSTTTERIVPAALPIVLPEVLAGYIRAPYDIGV